jgi:predicted DNA-binding transcriptional regulator AlpA
MDTNTQFGQTRRPKVKAPVKGDRLLTLNELPEKGIRFSISHLRNLMAAGKFPKPIKLSPRKSVWAESTIDSWIAGRIAKSAA